MLYRLARFIISLFLSLFNRWDVEGIENLPARGPVVLVANHVSLWDPVVLGCSIRSRIVHYMAKEDLFKIPVFGSILPHLQCFPVKRGKIDRNALRTAAGYLESGEILGLFPEGSRGKNNELLPFQPGAALFALRSGAPIVPVGLTGTKTAFPCTIRGRIRVRFGQPLTFQELYGQKLREEELENVMAKVKAVIQDLLQNK